MASRCYRRVSIALTCLVGGLATAGAVEAQDRTLIRGAIQSGGFGGPLLKATEVAGAFRVLAGGRGAWVINRAFAFGGGGYWLVTPADFDAGLGRRIRLGYGGLEAEYIFSTTRVVHWSTQLLIGAGAAWLTGEGPGGSADLVFVVEPQVNAELNVARLFRVAAGLGYRLVTSADLAGVDNGDLGGVAGTFTVKLGTF